MPDSLLRVGTCNVRTMAGRMGAIMDMAADAHLHILCLQETKLRTEGIHALRQAFRAKGWRFMPGGFRQDAQGKPDGGVAFVTDWPAELVTFPLAETFPHRIMAVKAHRPRQRPLLVINAYLPANDEPLNQHLCSSVVEWAATTGEDYIIMADWNREPKQQPLGNLLASGAIFALDPDPFFNELGTHRLESGVYTGKTIDFGIASVGIGTTSRLQRLGPADHDLVAYDIPLQGTRRGWRWQPRRLLHCEATFDWHELWADAADEFTVLLDAGNTEAAWKLLSATAEDALAMDSRRARPRGEPGRPLLVEAHAAKPPTVQTLKERKLRRAARRLLEVLKNERAGIRTVDDAKGKLFRYLRHIVAAYPDLADLLHYHDDELLAFLQHAAEEEETRANQARLAGWKDKVKTDIPRLSRWVKAWLVEPPTAMADFAGDPDPQAKAEQAAGEWSKLWHRDGRPADARLRELIAELRLPHALAPPGRVCGDVLFRRARASAHKAAGCDDWSGRLWRALPLEFFGALADIWNSVLAGSPIPEAWTQVRICLIPKEEGGQRPLAIAALAWRLGATAVVQHLTGWIKTVFSQDLYGGLPERSVEDVHFKLTHALFVQQAGGPLAGARPTSGSASTPPTLGLLCSACGQWGPPRTCWTSLAASTRCTLAGSRSMACSPRTLWWGPRLCSRAVLSAHFV